MDMVIKYTLCIILLIICAVNGTHLLEEKEQEGYKELVSVNISTPRRQRRSTGELRDHVDIAFSLKGHRISLVMERTDAFTDIPLSVLNGGKVKRVSNNWNFLQGHIEAYQNEESTAAFSVLYGGSTQNNSAEIFGYFISDGKEYSIQPADDSKNRTSALTHLIKEIILPSSLDKDYLQYDGNISGDKHSGRSRTKRDAAGSRTRREVDPIYTVELLLVLDYSVYEFWNKISTAKSKEEAWNQKQTSIIIYYSTIINGMDARYKKLTSPRIRIRPVEILIATDPRGSFWTDDNLVKATPKDEVYADTALDEFAFWSIGADVTPHDHAMLVTKYNLIRNGRDTQGLAYVGGICGTLRQSIVEDDFNFILPMVAAHELGHSLGAEHDGDMNLCDSDKAYIMASSVPEARRGERALNPWIFSKCSINYFKEKLDALNNDEHGNCLTIRNSPKSINISKYLTPPFGQLEDADAQCRYALGNGSRFCPSSYRNNYTTICTRMLCRNPRKPGHCTGVFAADGTTCADRKICINGVCSYSPEAPMKVCYGNYGQYCKGIKSSDCYSAYALDNCCTTCKNLENSSLPQGKQHCKHPCCNYMTLGDSIPAQ